ncbi:hypothetical protein B0A49_01535 [Cryomyces minteri]|uniref:Uncharacterized protein n=1 Tax=Cryomyces minteri TaxID=331657 RepID=A0A4U0XW20_9PEZI|nr:hypothetical protein B0A49_01535 [Cryomyces minteri]
MAARDRFGGFPSEPATTPLQRYIQNACDPQNFEPNLALDLEIADLINAKKGNAPREAAVAIVNYINHRNPNVSLLALSLLDICVKNCGYPFHLQISTKDFLNELVRRFPERPPIRATRVQNKILELIEEWRQTICKTSKYKEDLGFIRDMHRLLSYKGYVFPEVKREDAAVLNPSDNLRSAEEMEEEERAAQSAKLQELIRRGGPHDLQEANKLMKVMAGYDTRHKTDYRAKAAEEVGKIQQKAKILEDMLQRHQSGDEIKEGDVFEELANALASAQPKIQKMCEEELDDTEAVAKLFEINDSIHRTIERYKLIKKGDLEGASKIPKGTLGTSGAGVTKGPDNELSLIDFGGPDDSAPPTVASTSSTAALQPASKGNALEDDLLGLSMGDDDYGVGGGISLGTGNDHSGMAGASSPASQQQKASTSQILSQFSQPPPSQPYKPSNDFFGSIGAPPPTPKSSTPIPSALSHPPPTQKPNPPALDPFATLSAHTSRQPSPFQFQHSTESSPVTPGLQILGFGTPKTVSAKQFAPSALGHQNNGSAVEDEWTFASSLPDSAHDLVVTSSSIKILFHVSRAESPEDVIYIKSNVSNNSAQPVSEFTLQVAVTKGYTLKLEPQSGRTLAAQAANAITQTIRLHGVERGKGNAVKMRWRASYVLGAEKREEQGEIQSLGVA